MKQTNKQSNVPIIIYKTNPSETNYSLLYGKIQLKRNIQKEVKYYIIYL